MTESERTAQVFTLTDGRQLGYAEWGAARADLAVFDFHGGPGCRLAVSADPDVLAAAPMRWVSVDRPGLGLSWAKPNRRVVDLVDDVVELADHLGIDRFAVAGWSMGGPYAAACAARLPERVRAVALLAPAPVDSDQAGAPERMGKAFAWVWARDEPWKVVQMYTALGLEARRNPDLAVALFSDGLSASESEIFARPEIAREFIEIMVEATRQGAAGLVDDLRVMLAPWGFDPATIGQPGVVWQGDDDSFVSIDMARAWGERVPTFDVRILAGEGHLFPFERGAELVELLSGQP